MKNDSIFSDKFDPEKRSAARRKIIRLMVSGWAKTKPKRRSAKRRSAKRRSAKRRSAKPLKLALTKSRFFDFLMSEMIKNG
jgi:hypothetical protein